MSAVLDGAAIRASRATLESKICGIFVAASSTDVFLSADISGWSPRMDVELELDFAGSLIKKTLNLVSTWPLRLHALHSILSYVGSAWQS